ncbi:translational initiation factor [Pueribacillus theae]|uniref:Translational initiation factor n=1 Tax=Pueribacillus theae TaxID=2171751 RepID=A0A2U1JYR1_9BACI|nr:muconolactone Delta-isomerase family protein [Pueribacillus theae]PWA10367.1 translational initiation factor [Pueribacillus theae]
MLFFIKVSVNQKELTTEKLWEVWEKEAKFAKKAIERKKIMNAYKVAGSRQVILIYDADSHDEIDRVFMAGLPLSDYAVIDEILPIRSYLDFAEDVTNRWKKPNQ